MTLEDLEKAKESLKNNEYQEVYKTYFCPFCFKEFYGKDISDIKKHIESNSCH